MNISEKVSYIKGLADGLAVDASTKEGKIILAMLDVLNDVALTLEDVDSELDDIAQVVTDIEDSLCDLEDEVYGDTESDCHCGCGDHDDYGYDDEFADEMYEVTCPKCDNTITVDYGVIQENSILCPNCGELLEFDFDDDETE